MLDRKVEDKIFMCLKPEHRILFKPSKNCLKATGFPVKTIDVEIHPSGSSFRFLFRNKYYNYPILQEYFTTIFKVRYNGFNFIVNSAGVYVYYNGNPNQAPYGDVFAYTADKIREVCATFETIADVISACKSQAPRNE